MLLTRDSLAHVRIRIAMQDDVAPPEARPILSEMRELGRDAEEPEWRETARWIGPEEFAADGDARDVRWSEPRVPALSLQSLLELRAHFLGCALLLDLEASSLHDTAEPLLDSLVGTGALQEDKREEVRKALLCRHRHHQPRGTSGTATPTLQPQGISRKASGTEPSLTCDVELRISEKTTSSTGEAVPPEILTSEQESNTQFMKNLPPKAVASNILVGELECLEDTVATFIRLKHAKCWGDITELPVPTQFLFILLGPKGSIAKLREVGRAWAALCVEETCHEVVYNATERQHLLTAVDSFLNSVKVLPRNSNPPAKKDPPIFSKESRKRQLQKLKSSIKMRSVSQKEHEEAGLYRTGRLFGGLVNDIQRKLPWYISDWKDGYATQCVASWLFLYIAMLLPLIMFGEVLSEVTGKSMAAMECLMAGCVCGIVYGVFSGQPVILLSATASVLTLEGMVFDFSRMMGWHYLSFRLWIGVWMAIILFIFVALDAASFARNVTRFTEESFAAIIDFNFMMKAVEHVLMVRKRFPILTKQGVQLGYNCMCVPKNVTGSPIMKNWANLTSPSCVLNNGALIGDGCFTPNHTPDVFVMSVILFVGTFYIIIQLKSFKMSFFFTSKVRQFISEFAVTIAIAMMILFDFVVGSKTPKVELQHEFKPTLPGRSWLVPALGGNPLWSVPLAVLPALFCTTLVFTDQQITTIIVNRKENQLRKGCGYHLDLCVLAGLTFICALMGLPWFTAATVLSGNHVKSLKMESEPTGEKRFLGVREQRVTSVLISVTIGLSVLITPLLRLVPMPVLCGMFLYSGMVGFKGLQLFNRLTIMLMAPKYHPDYMYLRRLPIRRVHLFTVIQLACTIMLWLVHTSRQTGILFPVALGLCMGVRKCLEFLFTPLELDVLDSIIPESQKRKEEDQQQLEQNEDENISQENCSVQKITSTNVSDKLKEISELRTHADELSPRNVCKQNRVNMLRAEGRRGSRRDSRDTLLADRAEGRRGSRRDSMQRSMSPSEAV